LIRGAFVQLQRAGVANVLCVYPGVKHARLHAHRVPSRKRRLAIDHRQAPFEFSTYTALYQRASVTPFQVQPPGLPSRQLPQVSAATSASETPEDVRGQ
jgi:hypothetical protein